MRWTGAWLLLLALLAGCAQGLRTEVVSPPNSAAAARLRHVAVFPFSGPAGEQITAQVESLLAQASENGQGFYTVVDRGTLQRALNELKLRSTGLVDPRSAARLGKFIGADGIYAGSVFVPPVSRKSSNQQRFNCNSSGSGKSFKPCASTSISTVSCLDKVAQFTIVPRLIAVETAQVVYQPTLIGQSEGSSCSDMGGEVDDATLVGQAATQAMNQLRDDVVPHVTMVDLRFKLDTAQLDEPTRARFDGAMAFAKSGRLDRACAIWRALSLENPANVTLSFDVAVCDENQRDYPAALLRLRTLDQALQTPDADINAALARVGKEAQQAQRAAQPQPAAASGIIRGGSGRPVRPVSP